MNQNHHVLVRTSACIISLGVRGAEFVDVCVCVCANGGRGVVCMVCVCRGVCVGVSAFVGGGGVCVCVCVCACVCVISQICYQFEQAPDALQSPDAPGPCSEANDNESGRGLW